jgi:hypothetical protein
VLRFSAKTPTHVTLDDVASMAAADENHRYELSPEGVLSIMLPADPEHALLVQPDRYQFRLPRARVDAAAGDLEGVEPVPFESEAREVAGRHR